MNQTNTKHLLQPIDSDLVKKAELIIKNKGVKGRKESIEALSEWLRYATLTATDKVILNFIKETTILTISLVPFNKIMQAIRNKYNIISRKGKRLSKNKVVREVEQIRARKNTKIIKEKEIKFVKINKKYKGFGLLENQACYYTINIKKEKVIITFKREGGDDIITTVLKAAWDIAVEEIRDILHDCCKNRMELSIRRFPTVEAMKTEGKEFLMGVFAASQVLPLLWTLPSREEDIEQEYGYFKIQVKGCILRWSNLCFMHRNYFFYNSNIKHEGDDKRESEIRVTLRDFLLYGKDETGLLYT